MADETVLTITIGVAILGLVLSVASLTAQLITWRYTGSFVKVSITGGYRVHPPTPGFEGELIRVTARNVGRTAVTVDAWSLLRPDGTALIVPLPERWQGPELPYRLEAGASADWQLKVELILDGITGSPDEARLRGAVWLGTGQRRLSRKGLRPQWVTVRRGDGAKDSETSS